MAAPKGNKYAEGCETSGRPTKWKDEYCQQLIDHMGSGLSFESFAGEIDVCRDTLYEWKKAKEEFLDAHKKGKDKLLNHFEKMGRAAMAGKIKNFNSAVWIFSMKNRFSWTDKQEVKQEIKDINVNIKEWDE